MENENIPKVIASEKCLRVFLVYINGFEDNYHITSILPSVNMKPCFSFSDRKGSLLAH